jgi:N-alpha-acetyl-L-2,4-diaminobutyrate deacetylase
MVQSDEKRSRVFHELDFDRPGKQIGYLRVPQSRNGGAWATVEVPIAVVNGAPGPGLLLTGGIHGDEYEGQIAISAIARDIDPASLRGRLILLPATDLPAALNGTRLCPLDNRDLNRCFPGDARGSFCQVLAHFIDQHLLPLVEVSLDIHSGGHSMNAALSSNMHFVDDPQRMAKSLHLADCFAAPYNVVFWGVDEGATLTSAVEARGILSVGTELNGWGRVSVEGVKIARRGIRNVLCELGMIDGTPDRRQADGQQGTRHMMVRDQSAYVFCPSDGLFEPCHEAGAEVAAGEIAGYLHFVEDWSRAPIPLPYRSSGRLWMAMGSGRAKKGDTVAVVMQPYIA